MKSELIIICTIVVFSLCLFACSSSLKKISLEDLNQLKECEVAVGGSLLITLKSNPTTGFKWEIVKITDKTVVKVADHRFEAPEVSRDKNGAPITGATGKELWTFRALKKGKSTIFMEYSQPWNGGTKADKTFILTIIVK